ncbi:MAG: Hsp20 family protein [Eggerthellaceae bacterium]|nr:Hsp20 family protein [Eggerthellaceae bacterium]
MKQADINAKFDNGVLTIVIPKKLPEPENEEPFAITIA